MLRKMQRSQAGTTSTEETNCLRSLLLIIIIIFKISLSKLRCCSSQKSDALMRLRTTAIYVRQTAFVCCTSLAEPVCCFFY